MNRTEAIAIYGSLTIDDLVFADGSTRWGVPGGGAAYAALGAAMWGREVCMIALNGSDFPMEILADRLNISGCRRVAKTLRNWGLYEEDGSRHFFSRSYAREWAEFCPNRCDVLPFPQRAAHIAPMPHDSARVLIRELRDRATPFISLDLDDHDGLKLAEKDEIIDLIRSVDLFLPSWQDVRTLFPCASPIECLNTLRRLAPEVSLIAIKCGRDGVVAVAKGSSEILRVPALPINLVDVTGAGDSFCGGVLASYARGDAPHTALIAGTVSASFCIEQYGFTGLLAPDTTNLQSRVSRLVILEQLEKASRASS